MHLVLRDLSLMVTTIRSGVYMASMACRLVVGGSSRIQVCEIHNANKIVNKLLILCKNRATPNFYGLFSLCEPTGHQKHELLVCATGRVGRFLAENQVVMERSQWPWDKIRRPMGGPGHDS